MVTCELFVYILLFIIIFFLAFVFFSEWRKRKAEDRLTALMWDDLIDISIQIVLIAIFFLSLIAIGGGC